ncbi:putative nicotinate-nucleotide adenylyltransferase NadD [Gottschalkia purinilytica]|uniref:Probable nicotinate-nucleotide adenylyltransferase n=1 Tax=Gottschalkia purinilytica TaxID=1503 RepID=A0A0L0WD78_GOTPU|nr:nicotinate-nucleotide adenylyltransferase [Gottschalkia purinilytica]KNF09434.1 putative nicotinate-nucleotide adenylyltransferase NadD [Gottschalkia purinilytica]
MNKKVKKYGIMGGTFDPIHMGHLVIAEEARYKFELDKVIFIPTGNPPHKKEKNVTLGYHRYEMTLLATLTNPYFEVSSIELDRKGLTYTIDTMSYFKEKYKDDVEFYFITGADSLLDLHTWKDSDKLLQMCKFIGATRPGFDLDGINVSCKYKKNVCTITIPELQVSSTDIRNRIKKGMPVTYLLPHLVQEYIEKNNLYRE